MTGFTSPNYTQAPNDLFDSLMSDMGEAELRVTLCAIRHTFGYHRDHFRLSLSAMMKATGMSKQGVINGAEAAEKRGTFSRKQDGGVTIWVVNVVDQSVNVVDNPVNEVDQTGQRGRLPSNKEKKEIQRESNKEGIPHPDFDAAISILSNQHPAEYQQARPRLVRSDSKPNRLLDKADSLPAGFTDLLQAALFAANPRRTYRVEFDLPTTQPDDRPAEVKPAPADDRRPDKVTEYSVTDYQRDTWDLIVDEMCIELQPATIRTCVNPNQLLSVNGKWTVMVPDVEWWSGRANQTVKRLYKAMTGETAEFEYVKVMQ